MKKKLLALLLMLTLLISNFALTVSAIVQAPVYTEGGTVEGKEDAFPAIQKALAQYQYGETFTVADDGYIGIPVYITVYNDASVTYTPSTSETMTHPYETTEPNYNSVEEEGKPIALYVINTNTTRVGTDSDTDIITSLMKEGYIVLVVDYKNEKRAKSPDLDWSVQKIRAMLTNKNHELYKLVKNGLSAWTSFNYVLPAGYSIKRGVQFFNFEDNGVDGVLDFIVDVWNVDLKYTEGSFGKGHRISVVWGQKELYDGTKVYQDADGRRCIPDGDGYVYYTQNKDFSVTKGEPVENTTTVTPLYKAVTEDAVWEDEEKRILQVRYTTAEDFWDCVNIEGERIDLNLYADIYYPTNPENKVPVMLLASSSQNRAGATQSADRPISSGYMFTGYAFVNYDHAYVPMARADHFDYFEGDPNLGRDANFTIVGQTGVQAQTAATRIVRYLANYYPDIFAFDVDRFGVWGHSKGAHVNFFAEEHPEQKLNQSYFPGHKGECTKEQPWLTYADGTAIPSNVQFVYASKGGDGSFGHPNGKVPFFLSHPEADTLLSENARYAFMLAALRGADAPSFAVTMEGVGHTTVHGYNDVLDLDMYQALFDFTDYFLYDRPSTCSYILPINGTTNVDVTDDIIIKFTGLIPRSEIESKVRIVNVTTGESVRGIWESAFAGNEWTFTPMNLEGGTTYRVDVPADLIDEKGHAIKAEKNTYYRTSFESTFKAAEVLTTNGSLTLSKTQNGANGVYFVFNPLAVDHNFGTKLRFSSTSKASTALNVYGITSLNEENIASSTLTATPIQTVGVAGAEIVEVDVSQYIASLPEGAKPAFYVEAAKASSTTTIYDADFDSADSRGPLAGKSASYFQTSPNGTNAYRVKVGQTYFVSNIFTSKLTEADYGRLITVSFDVCSTITRDFFARFTLERVIQPENGKCYIDSHNDTGVTAQLVAGEWQRITLTYLINDYDYTEDWIQKRALSFGTSIRPIDGEYLYIDNLLVTETVVDATISDKDTAYSIAPTLAVESAVLNEQTLVGGGYVVNGEDSDKTFDGKDGYHISGPSTSGVGDIRVSYFEVDISALDFSSPYALALQIKSGNGTVSAYGLTPDAMENFRLDTLTYQNAPALDRASASVIPSDVHGGAPLASYEATEGNYYIYALTRYLLDMKALGQSRAVIMFATDDTTTEAIAFQLVSDKITITKNELNFDQAESIPSTSSRPTKHETYDIFFQKPASNNTITAELDETTFVSEAGKCLKIVNDGTSDFFTVRMLKLINKDNSTPAFTQADVGKTYSVSFRIYLPDSASYSDGTTKNVYIGLSHIKNNKNASVPNYVGNSSGQLYSPQRLNTLKFGEWNEIHYSFTVSEMMIGASPSSYAEDTRPINFSIIGLRGVTYLDDFRYTEVQDAQSNDWRSTSSFTTDFATAKDVTATYFTKGGDPTYTQATMSDAIDGFAADLTSAADYDRVFLKNLLEKTGFTEANLGDSYTYSLRLKATKAGSFQLDLANRNLSGVKRPAAAYGMPAYKTVTVTEDMVGEWFTVEYTFTLTQSILDVYNAKVGDPLPTGSGTYTYAGSERFGLRIYFDGFAQSANDPVHLYIDTASVYRNAPMDNGRYLANVPNITVSMQLGTVNDSSIGATELLDSTLKKGYFAYTLPTISHLYRATLTLKALAHAGQSFHLWAIDGHALPELLTWNNAPGNNLTGEGILAKFAYGDSTLASFTFDENGNATIDVTDFVNYAGAGDVIFVLTASGAKKEFGDAIIEAPVLSLYTPEAQKNDMAGIVEAHNVVITDKLSYNLYIPADKNVTALEYAGTRYEFASLPDKEHEGKTYKRFTADIVAKDAFLMHSVTVYLADGSIGEFDLSIHHYLEGLCKSEENEKLSTLASDMVSYLAASIIYFCEEDNASRANAAIAIRDYILGDGYDEKHPPKNLTETPALSSTDSGMRGAGMHLAERPTFYFVAAEGYENETPVFTIGGKTLSYQTISKDGLTYFTLTHSPLFLKETVTYTIGDKSGVFNLRAYYDYAVAENDASLVRLVERLYRYSESLENYLA